MRRWWPKLLLLAASCGVSVLVLEVSLRTVVPITTFRYESVSGEAWNMPDDELQYALTRGYRGRMVSSEFDNEVRVNSLGFRGPEPTLDDSDSKVFFVGDSFVFGAGVDLEEAIPARVERGLWEAGHRSTRVWNLGVPGYSSPQYVGALERFLSYASPRVVVVCYYLGRLPSGANDLSGSADFDAWINAKRLPLAPNAAVQPAPQSPPRRFDFDLRRFLLRRSATANLILLRFGPVVRTVLHSRREISRDAEAALERGWEIIERDLSRVVILGRRHEFATLVVYLPEHPDLIAGYREADQRLAALAEVAGVSYVSGFEALKDHAFDSYYPMDGHLNGAGVERAAKPIVERLVLQLSLADSSPPG